MHAKTDLEKLAQVRLDDAVLLLQANRSSSAYYLSGYAVELALKACVAKLMQANVIPDKAFVNAIYTHRFDTLLSAAGLLPQFQQDTRADPQFGAYWAIASKWTEESRHEFWDPMAAATMIQAVHEPTHGVWGFESSGRITHRRTNAIALGVHAQLEF
jgi:hypothetical protein